ncbi:MULTISPECIES: hypothetical protein [Nostoc]|uniref:DUF1574 domain-containing protein n=1 Tax=Nostoc paludosum FACHB-159 TaxID=2692908 RepID=A0ABR8K5S1_9NOSO|nr:MULTISPECIES: hypothetical protein [Nostoc]MBD2677420.1 hypothetical protein [Nostoc sp. FACHB-857]MBD2734186.1 hypothetical protein [Nostoc paludosum FACHB-159]
MKKKPIFILLYGWIFILCLILTNGLINLFLPTSNMHQNLGDVSAKLAYFTKHKDNYDIIFLGPSTTYYGVIPKIFDESIAANGNNLKSFNFGIMSANVAEMDFYLQKILALKPAKLKWIFLDCLVNSFVEETPTATKNVYWHTPIKTLENIKLISESTLNLPIKIIALYANSVSFIHNWLGIGNFSDYVNPRITATPGGILSDRVIQESGYYAMDWMNDIEQLDRIFQEKYLQIYQQELKQAKSESADSQNISKYPLDSYAIKIIKKMIDRINNQEKITHNKIEPIFLIPPALNADVEHTPIMRAFNLGYVSTLFAFNNPNKFPSLFELANRSDQRHLNYQGSEKFTKILAAEFSNHLKLSEQR